MFDIMNYTFQPNSSVREHVNQLRRLNTTLVESGGDMADNQLVLHLLHSMPEEYEQTVLNLRMKAPATLTLDYVCNALVAAETHFATMKKKTASAFVAQSNQRSAARGRKAMFSAEPRVDKSGLICSHCKSTAQKEYPFKGHTKERCFRLIGYPDWWGSRPRDPTAPSHQKQPQVGASSNNKTKKRSISDHRSSSSSDSGGDDDGSFVGTVSLPATSSAWVLDSGSTVHICRDRSLLLDYTAIPPMNIQMGSTSTAANAMG